MEITAPPAGGEKALLPSHGVVPGMPLATMLAVARDALSTLARGVAGVAAGPEGAVCGWWLQSQGGRERLSAPSIHCRGRTASLARDAAASPRR